MNSQEFIIISGLIIGSVALGTIIGMVAAEGIERRRKKRARAIPRGTGNPPGRPKKSLPPPGPILPIDGPLPPEWPKDANP